MATCGRSEFALLLEAGGAKVTSQVSSRVTDLVVGDAPGSKLVKAEKLGINILTEQQCLDLIAAGEQDEN